MSRKDLFSSVFEESEDRLGHTSSNLIHQGWFIIFIAHQHAFHTLSYLLSSILKVPTLHINYNSCLAACESISAVLD